MNGSRGVAHRVMACLVAVAFAFCMTGCERTVTKYDETGKPYSEKEFDPWMTIGGFILFGIILGGVIYAAEVNSTELLDENKALLAYAKSPDVANDAAPILSREGKWIQVKDAQGRLISRHLLHLDRLQSGGEIVHVSKIQEKVEISQEALSNLVAELERERESGSLAEGIEAEVSFQEGDASALRINGVRVLQREAESSAGSQVIVASGLGLFRVRAVPDGEPGHVRVTVSELR